MTSKITVQTERNSFETFALRWDSEGKLTGVANLFGNVTWFLDRPNQLANIQFTTTQDVPYDGSLAWARGDDGDVEWASPLVIWQQS